jgi:dTDP-4-amino-4,6-dideoxygalactose transaminase
MEQNEIAVQEMQVMVQDLKAQLDQVNALSARRLAYAQRLEQELKQLKEQACQCEDSNKKEKKK